MTFRSENTEEVQSSIEKTVAQRADSLYWEWFCSIPGIYRRHREILLRCFGGPEGVWQAGAGEWKHLKEHGCDWAGCVETYQKESDPQETVYKNRQLGIQFTSCEQSDYPKLLRSIQDFPYGIFYKVTIEFCPQLFACVCVLWLSRASIRFISLTEFFEAVVLFCCPKMPFALLWFVLLPRVICVVPRLFERTNVPPYFPIETIQYHLTL